MDGYKYLDKFGSSQSLKGFDMFSVDQLRNSWGPIIIGCMQSLVHQDQSKLLLKSFSAHEASHVPDLCRDVPQTELHKLVGKVEAGFQISILKDDERLSIISA